MSISAGADPHRRQPRVLQRIPIWVIDALLKATPLLVLAWVVWGANAPQTGLLGASVNPTVMLGLEFICAASVALSRTRPKVTIAVAASAATVQILLGYGPGVASCLAVPLIVHAAAKYGSPQIRRTALTVGLSGALLVGLHVVLSYRSMAGPLPPDLGLLLLISCLMVGFCAAVVVAAWAIGFLAGRRRRELETIAERNRLLERERWRDREMAAEAERLRIAREMHDVISHSMSAMIAQADGGRYVLDADPAQARGAFESIGATGRVALRELRQMLGVLREEGELKTLPSPGMANIGQLVEDIRASGVNVTVESRLEEVPELTESAGLTVFRLVQEALTNTLKHGGPHTTAQVWIYADPDATELVVDVRDTGRGSAAATDGAGAGLRGMEERARLYGGSLHHGPGVHGKGYRICARLPLDKVRADQSATDQRLRDPR